MQVAFTGSVARARARFAPERSIAALTALLAACSPPPSPPDAAVPVDDSGVADAGVTLSAVLSLLELAMPGGEVRLQAVAEIGLRSEGGGCALGPRPPDADGAWLRISGYRLGGQPTLCTNEDGGYVCRLPSNDEADVVYPAGSDPLGPGPILFAVGGGHDMGPAVVSVPRGGTLAATLDGATLHVSCSDDCSGERVIALADGLLCDFAFAPSLTLPRAPGPVSVARARPLRAGDGRGAVLIGRVGRGVRLP